MPIKRFFLLFELPILKPWGLKITEQREEKEGSEKKGEKLKNTPKPVIKLLANLFPNLKVKKRAYREWRFVTTIISIYKTI